MIRKSKTAISEGEFENREDLVEIRLPDEVKRIGADAFYGCKRLRSISLPDGITKIGANAFLDCNSLSFFTEGVCRYLGNEKKPRLALVDAAYDGRENTELIIPDGVRLLSDSVFYYFLELGSVVLPESLEYIGDGAFYHCEKITSVKLGGKLKSIGKNAFYGCDSLIDVYFGGNEDEWNRVKIAAGNTRLKKAKIHFNSKDK